MDRLLANPAPDFTMQALAADGESFQSVSLADYKGAWLVLFFYPMDFTFVCPTELTAFSERLEEFKQAGAKLLSVSTDSVYTHLAWRRNGLGKLGYPMGADQALKACRDFGVLLEDDGVALRGLFIIDPDQIVRYSLIHDNDIGRNPDEVLRVLHALQSGGLCAANWNEGQDNLSADGSAKPSAPSAPTGSRAPVCIYTMPDCSYCKHVKDYLRDAGVRFDEVDLATDKDGQAFMESRGYTGLPVTVIEGEEIVGVDIEAIARALREAK